MNKRGHELIETTSPGDEGTSGKKHKPEEKTLPSESTALPDASIQFLNLLDLSPLNCISDISARFDDIAIALLHDFCLTVTHGDEETEYVVLELEFYLQSPSHKDPFTHGSEEQSRSGRWYFHRAPRFSADSTRNSVSTALYRSGSRKGMDLTIGGPIESPYFPNQAENQASGIRGGVLIRTLRRMSDSKVISGPSLLVDEILRASGTTDIPELVEQRWGGNISAFPLPSTASAAPSTSLFLRPIPAHAVEGPQIYRSPRIGLDLSHPGTTNSATHPRVVFLSKPYRYFVHPSLLTSNGRSHTFLGVYQSCLESGLYHKDETRLKWELAKLTGLKEQTVTKYLADYKSGVDKGNLDWFIGSAGKGASGSPATYLKMMGTLDRIRTSGSLSSC